MLSYLALLATAFSGVEALSGMYCSTHTVMGHTAEVRAKLSATDMSFRIDRDMHWSWCSGNKYTVTGSNFEIVPSACFNQ